MDGRTDIELAALARKGDRDAFGQLAHRYQMITQRLAMRLIGEEASCRRAKPVTAKDSVIVNIGTFRLCQVFGLHFLTWRGR